MQIKKGMTLDQIIEVVNNKVDNSDDRLTDSRVAKDVYSWAKSSIKPSYNKSEIGLSNVDNVKQYSTINKPTAIDIGAEPTLPTNVIGKIVKNNYDNYYLNGKGQWTIPSSGSSGISVDIIFDGNVTSSATGTYIMCTHIHSKYKFLIFETYGLMSDSLLSSIVKVDTSKIGTSYMMDVTFQDGYSSFGLAVEVVSDGEFILYKGDYNSLVTITKILGIK